MTKISKRNGLLCWWIIHFFKIQYFLSYVWFTRLTAVNIFAIFKAAHILCVLLYSFHWTILHILLSFTQLKFPLELERHLRKEFWHKIKIFMWQIQINMYPVWYHIWENQALVLVITEYMSSAHTADCISHANKDQIQGIQFIPIWRVIELLSDARNQSSCELTQQQRCWHGSYTILNINFQTSSRPLLNFFWTFPDLTFLNDIPRSKTGTIIVNSKIISLE